MKEINFLFIIGKGGSGKDTQADLLREEIDGSVRISTGNIYRGARTVDGEYGRFHYLIGPYVSHVDNGGYLPDKLIVSVVKEVVREMIEEGKTTFIFTGFPRTEGQLDLVDEMLDELRVAFVVHEEHIYFRVGDETSRERARKRRERDLVSGKAPRKDDLDDVLDNRLEVFADLTMPMIKRLVGESRLLSISAERGIDEVRAETGLRIRIER